MKPKPNIVLSHDFHRGKAVVVLRFDYNLELINLIKNIGGARWSQSKQCWYFIKDEFHLPAVFKAFQPISYVDYSALDRNKRDKRDQQKTKTGTKLKVELPRAYIDVLDQRRYSESTKATYTNYFADFVRHFQGRDLTNISVEEINNYLLELIRKGNISSSQQNQRINAIKFYYEKVLGREKFYYKIERPKRSNTLPNVLSTAEVKLMIDKTKNINPDIGRSQTN